MPDLLETSRRKRYRRHVKLSVPQYGCITSEARYRGLAGGRGSGKTYAGCHMVLVEAQRYPGCTGEIVAPTYGMIEDIIVPTLRECCGPILETFNKSRMVMTLINGSRILLRSADKPDRLRGPNLSWFWVDEAAMLTRYVWKVLIATLREGGRAGRAWITTTPRGKANWVYELFVDAPPAYHLEHSSSRDNPFLHPEFLSDLQYEYGTGRFARQEIEGLFEDEEGTVFQRQWLPVVDHAPERFKQVVRGWDLALTTKQSSNWTTGVKVGLTQEGVLYVLDVVRVKLEWPEVRELIKNTAKQDGRSVIVAVEKVGFQTAAVQELLRERDLLKFTVRGVPRERDKKSYAYPIAVRAEQGLLRLVRGSWNDAFIDELCAFTGDNKGTDDQVDGIANAYQLLATRREPRVRRVA